MSKVTNLVITVYLMALVMIACTPSFAGYQQTEESDNSEQVAVVHTSTTTPFAPDLADVNPTSMTPSATETQVPLPETTGVSAELNPLTGLFVEDPTILDRRPVLIKVSNYPASLRPHSGLSYADLVWEYFIGNGMTRFLALYYGQDAAQVGPVRSGRLVDGQLVRLYGGYLGMVGADRFVWSVIGKQLPGRIVSEKPTTCPPICRVGNTFSVFADSGAFTYYVQTQELDNQRPDLGGMVFDEWVPDGGKPATNLRIYFSYYNQIGWDYDPESGLYLRLQEVVQDDNTIILEPMPDCLTGEQLAFENVIMLFAPHEVLKPELVDIDVWSADGARAIFFRDGRLYEGTYSAPSTDTPLHFFDAEGNSYRLKPGNTWFMILGTKSIVEEVEEGVWKGRFYP
ncbi:MAG: DUF3048 domain-containing protein [Anaerolineales bacterium]|nr:DUF3048 domain-containing protein [Anaerolineales bacterium]